MPGDPAAQAAAAAAAQKAFRNFTIELFTLYGTGVLSTFLRTYARIRAVGTKGLRADDVLVWFGIIFYSAQAGLGYSIGHVAKGLANNAMTDAERAALSPSDPEYRLRVIGSQIQIAAVRARFLSPTDGGSWSVVPLSSPLGRVASLTPTLCSARTDEPPDSCQPAISLPIVWVSFASNICTDLYLILIPIPMLWRSRLKTIKKIASSVVLGAGIFVLVCATLKSIFVLVDPFHGAQQAGEWGTREAFVAVITTNLPMLFPLFRVWLTPFCGNLLRSSKKSCKTPTGFVSIGGGGPASTPRNRSGPRTANPITENMTFSESEERIVDDVKLENVQKEYKPPNTIVVSNQVEITHSNRNGQLDARTAPGHEQW
ncbi:hypothetical protein UVI_02024520 [Ustilaginoidea virens]|uniref:Rhodopsin domain-containing protein n=1 Tax=Ustilaginoidea virens TaxID=1159556 RepID=A0A1B5KQW5_USTVR|nr:hypothetical protein UVI_02024520 [Ustilaginoidea virens]